VSASLPSSRMTASTLRRHQPDGRSDEGAAYSGPALQGPVMASVIPLPGDPFPKMFTNSVRPDGLKQAPASSESFSRLTANSKASPSSEIPIRRLTSVMPGASGWVSPSCEPASSSM
jgi:hypothetical protein